ncbi:WD repeat and HMG-box DNA-binding protein 1-like [Sycon ciliatum]|uniref:WD repeat and HMG-box DNA-binding protein 1-like n=1 Tax=Sycon ciliatum TaxID=27933 RepID=UPI0031F636DD
MVGVIAKRLAPMGAQERLLAQTMNASAQIREQRKAMKSNVAKQQPPFQVCSTPSRQHTYFMAYNDVGVIRCKREDSAMSMLDVEFHDTSTYHAMHISNTSDYDLAALSEEAVAFACSASGEGKNKLECRHFSAWDGAKEWSTVMNKKESIQNLTVGSSFVAVATSRQLLRVWTLSGVQSFMATLPGTVVTMAAHRDLLAVAYHHGIGAPHQQCMSCQVYQNHHGTLKLLRTVAMPLAHKTTLAWLGFSTCGFLCVGDSAGLLHMLLCQPAPVWLPISDLRSTLKTKEDRYWLVGVDDEMRQTKCVHCKDATYPPCNPRPVIAVLDFSPPVCELATEKAQLEMEYLRLHSTTAGSDSNPAYPAEQETVELCRREETAALMKLFALACKTDRESRALDICTLLPTEHAMSLAQRYASRVHRINLAQRIDDLIDQKAQQAEFDEDARLIAGFGSQIVAVPILFPQVEVALRWIVLMNIGSSTVSSYSTLNRSSLPASTSSSSSSSLLSTTNCSSNGKPRLQPRAQLVERHRQHRKAGSVVSSSSIAAATAAGPASPSSVSQHTGGSSRQDSKAVSSRQEDDNDVTESENPEFDDGGGEDLNNVDFEEENEDEWAAADEDMSDSESKAGRKTASKIATTPKSKTAGKVMVAWPQQIPSNCPVVVH